jgi:putative ABC transport system substrate-binding protein
MPCRELGEEAHEAAGIHHIGGAVAAWPLTASGKAPRIAIVVTAVPVTLMTETSGDPLFQGLFSELRRLGYVEGQSLLVERYSGGGQASHYADLAREVVNSKPDVVISIGSNDVTLDFKAATTTIPIVGVFGAPVEDGIVASLARPGGNITGVAVDVGLEQWGKRIQLLQQVVPQATRLGYLESRTVRERYDAFERERDQRIGITRVGPPFDHPADEAEYRRVFAALSQDGAEGIMVLDEAENIANLKLVVDTWPRRPVCLRSTHLRCSSKPEG